MNFIRRWRYGAERHQEQLLVKLWTINTLDADEHTQSAQLTPKQVQPQIPFYRRSGIHHSANRLRKGLSARCSQQPATATEPQPEVRAEVDC
jgi:hypothetical protein